MIENTAKEASIFWQKGTEDNPITEPAILIDKYNDTFSLTQCDIGGNRNSIRFNYTSAKELGKFLSKIEPPE